MITSEMIQDAVHDIIIGGGDFDISLQHLVFRLEEKFGEQLSCDDIELVIKEMNLCLQKVEHP